MFTEERGGGEYGSKFALIPYFWPLPTSAPPTSPPPASPPPPAPAPPPTDPSLHLFHISGRSPSAAAAPSKVQMDPTNKLFNLFTRVSPSQARISEFTLSI